MTQKKAWRCRACGQEHTPRCPTCRVVVTGAEAADGKCDTCASPLTHAVYNCPHCDTAGGLRPPAIPRPWQGSDLVLKGLLVLRFLLGILQMSGFLLFAVSCSASFGAVEEPTGPSLQTLQLAGLAAFVVPIPLQVYVSKTINRVSMGAIEIGARRRSVRPPDR